MFHVCLSMFAPEMDSFSLEYCSSVLEDSSVGRFSVAVVDRSSGSIGCAHIPTLHMFNCHV